MAVAFISHPECALHDAGPDHPERAERLTAIEDRLVVQRLDMLVTHYEAPLATREQLLRVHSAEHIAGLEQLSPASGLAQIDPDTAMSPHTLQAALRAAGAAVLGVDLVLAAKERAAFCSVRPPGHHAERSRAMGFCFFNNVAVGMAHALAHHGLSRVAVADFDVHHGNGTEDIFRGDGRVLMVSTFQHPFYPGSGVEGRSERMVNIPLAAGNGETEFRAAVTDQWLPALERFQPEMLFFSAGFDAHLLDDMATLGLVEADYAWVTETLREATWASARGRIVSVLEGGYHLQALSRSTAAHIERLIRW
jgi:acetoin utilization deacetylase AcuC-like enzyme